MFKIFKKKNTEPFVPFKCGVEFDPLTGSRWDYLASAYHKLEEHDSYIITEGNKRKRKIVCIPTGKWWYEEMKSLEQVK